MGRAGLRASADAEELLSAEDGEVQFEVALARSSWVALRILPSSHSNPIFLLVGGKPIRASKRSAKWCLKSVDQSWSEKEKFIQKNKLEKELEGAKAA